MESLVDQLKSLPERYQALPMKFKTGIVVGAVLALLSGVVGAVMASSNTDWQYLYTSLSDADASEAARVLEANAIPYRLDAANKALAVGAPDSGRAALLLLAEGIPHADAEVVQPSSLDGTEVTRDKLRSARETKLSQTLSNLGELRTARVIISEPKRRLLPGQDVPASASVMVRLHPGRQLNKRQIAGIQHFVASAVQHLEPENVSIIDGQGTMLSSAEEDYSGNLEARARTEQEVAQKVLAVLKPLVKEGHVVAQVHVDMDASLVEEQQTTYAEDTVLGSERITTEQRAKGANVPGGVVGAAANTPLDSAAQVSGRNGQSAAKNDTRKDYLVGKTVRVSKQRAPRVTRMTVAVLVDSPLDNPKTAADLALYEKLAKEAAGFDVERGDTLTLTGLPFYAEEAAPLEAVPASALPFGLSPMQAALLAMVLAVLLVGGGILWRRRKQLRDEEQSRSLALLEQGGSVAELEKKMAEPITVEVPAEEKIDTDALQKADEVSPEQLLREAAIRAAQEDPRRAAYLLRAWLREGLVTDGVPTDEEEEVARAA